MKTHEFLQAGWGHDCYASKIMEQGGQRIQITGWCHGIKEGDYLILRNGTPQGVRYQVKSIKYYPNPKDMFTGEAVFAPRKVENG